MCGIFGLISQSSEDHARVGAMTDLMAHRGPDSRGLYHDGDVSLGHRRLSIIDLSDAGRQPMSNEDGSLHLVCNGEIYNYQELRSGLVDKGHHFHSGSDSEVLLHLYEEKGDDLLDGVNGMFAFAIWDSRRSRLIAGVDRFGKKPLYWAVKDGRLVLASEMKTLLGFRWIDRRIDHSAIDSYLTFRYIPAPQTIYSGISKLEPATRLVFGDGLPRISTYWRPAYNPYGGDIAQATEQVEELVTDAIRIRLNSDVPLGIYLSGGIDSASIAGLMAGMHPERKVAYSVSFDYQYDERAKAEAFARHLGFSFNAISVDAGDFSSLPTIARHLDEPYGDMIVLPAWRLAQAAKRELTVVLTGDGADEIFGGYMHQKMMARHRALPGVLKSGPCPAMLARLMDLVPSGVLDKLFDYPDRFGPNEKTKLVRAISQAGHFGSFYEGITSCFTGAEKRELYTPEFLQASPPADLAAEYQAALDGPREFPFVSRLGLMDLKYWLPFILLFRLDKLNMAHAVETRSPYLDYRLVELALGMPDHFKLGKRSKEVLRRVHERTFPPALWTKGKQAFYMPFLNQYRARLDAWFADMLGRPALEARGLFRPQVVERLLASAKEGSMLANRQLVALAMLEQWFRIYEDQQA